MSTHTRISGAELERRRRLAVERVRSGYSQQETAKFLGVSKTSVSQWMKAHRQLESFPLYAPELNPVEQLWNHLKYAKLANFAAEDVRQLDQLARRHLHRIKRSPSRLQSFLNAADLNFT